MSLPALGVVVVAFNSGEALLDCLESLLAATGVRLAIVVVDNASTDGTAARLCDWAAGRRPPAPPAGLPFPLPPVPKPVPLRDPARDRPLAAGGHAVTLIAAGVNGGFAAGVNIGLTHLAAEPGLSRFWVLNPDSLVPPDTPRAFATDPGPPGGFALMGGRVIYLQGDNDRVQSDGGLIDRRTGITRSSGQFGRAGQTPPPDPARLDFISGASLVASRAFLDRAGPMPEDYFLYYEEVDWALRRGDLPLAHCAQAIVYHVGGTAIGSGVPGRPAAPFALYFLHRARLRFVRRHRPRCLPGAWAYSLAKAAQLLSRGHASGARAILAGSRDAPPPAEIRSRLSPEAQRLAFDSPWLR